MAQSCTFSNTGVNFGNVTLLSGVVSTATGTFTANCAGTPGRTIRICANFNEGSGGIRRRGNQRLMRQGNSRMRYNLYSTSGNTQIWGSYTWGFSSLPKAISLTLNGVGFGSSSDVIYGRLGNQQPNLPPGIYTSTFSGSHTQIDYGYAPNFNCSSNLSSRVQNVPFVVRAANTSSCTVTATDLSFGSHANLNVNRDATNLVSVLCTAGTQYELGLNSGSSGSSNTAQRRMTNSATTSSIVYSIYRNNNRTQVWGNTNNTMVSGTGTGANQNYTGYGRVPAQATPPSLTYTDNVIVTITY